MASIVMSSEPCAVITMTSVLGVSLLMRLSKSIPLPSGSRRSVKTRSYGEPLSSSFASPMLLATSTRWPSSLRMNRSASPMLGSSSTARIRLGDIFDLLCCRQRHGNPRALAGLTTKRDGTAVLVDDSFSVGHTEAEALRLGCIESLEDLFHLLFIDPWTSVGDLELHCFVNLGNGDTQRATLRHGLNGIFNEI